MRKTMPAAKRMERMIENGLYPMKTQTEKELDLVKSSWKNRLKDSENRRHEYGEIVTKWVPKKDYEWDYPGLVDFLLSYLDAEFVTPMLKPNHALLKKDEELAEDLSPFLLPERYYCKPNFNKLGRLVTKPVLPSVENYDESTLAVEFKQLKPLEKHLKAQYEAEKRYMNWCKQLRKKKKVEHAYGSVSLIPHKPTYNLKQMVKEEQYENICRAFSPDMGLLEDWMIKGVISKSDVNMFRVFKDVRLDFIVMFLEDEQKMFEHLQEKRNNALAERIV